MTTYRKLSVRVALAVLLAVSLRTAVAQDVVHAVSGSVTKIDKEARSLTVKAEDGTEHAFKYSDKTTVRGYHDASKMAKAGGSSTSIHANSTKPIAGDSERLNRRGATATPIIHVIACSRFSRSFFLSPHPAHR